MNTPENSTAENGRGAVHGSADAPDFRSELCTLINKHSMENGSNTPDFILNQFLADVLMCFNEALRRRDDWYGGKSPYIVAFVQGAQWWEYHKSGATMWPSDRDQAEGEAEKRVANGTLGMSPIDEVSEVAVADSTKTRGVRPPLSLD